MTRTSAAGRGSKDVPRDRPSHASHSLIGHVPTARPNFFLYEFSRDVLRLDSGGAPGQLRPGSEGSRPVPLKGWGERVSAAGEWLSGSSPPPHCGSRRPEAQLDFEPASATWTGTVRRGLGGCGHARKAGGSRGFRPSHSGGYVKSPDLCCWSWLPLSRPSPPLPTVARGLTIFNLFGFSFSPASFLKEKEPDTF